jgi:hypothetical protein
VLGGELLRYIELKEGSGDRGPAWIARVEASRTGRTIYFNGCALKRGQGVSGNHYDAETGEEYWVSAPKRRGNDRHWAGGGRIRLPSNVVIEYLAWVGADEVDLHVFEVVEPLPETDPADFVALENGAG